MGRRSNWPRVVVLTAVGTVALMEAPTAAASRAREVAMAAMVPAANGAAAVRVVVQAAVEEVAPVVAV